MKRRNFLKSMGAMGLTASIPSALTLQSLTNKAYADSPDYSAVNYAPPSVMPQVINIFLYGGPSELSGNLTNIGDINANSQNAYPPDLLRAFDPNNLNQNDANFGRITPNNFWWGAGGESLEFMLKYGHMSMYRTIMKQKEPTRSHRESLFMSLKGTLDIENSPGFGTRLATVLGNESANPDSPIHNVPLANGQTVAQAGAANGATSNPLYGFAMPFVSFEGTSTIYAPDPSNALDIRLKSVTMSDSFENPYSRNDEGWDDMLNTLVQKVHDTSRFESVANAFELRVKMAQLVDGFTNAAQNNPENLLPDSARDGFTVDPEDAPFFNGTALEYPNNNRFSRRVQAAVTLAIENPQTLFISVGDGFGGWDHHNNGMDVYPERMEELMAALRVAMLHIKYTDSSRSAAGTPLAVTTPGRPANIRQTDNIVINMYGDFGRLTNRNNSNGWDHANNQNLFTFGGAAVRPGGAAALGKIIGRTGRVGTSGTNNQYTVPVGDSYTAEPMAISSSVYSYFGVTNSQILTRDGVTDRDPNGDIPLNEGLASEPIAAADFV